MTAQESQLLSFHALTTSIDPANYNEAAILAAEDAASATGTYNERLLQLLNFLLTASHTSLPEAQNAMAQAKGATNWGALSDIS